MSMARMFATWTVSRLRLPTATRSGSCPPWPAADDDDAPLGGGVRIRVERSDRRARVPSGRTLREHPRRDRAYPAGGPPADVAEPGRPHPRQARGGEPDRLGQG